jgi:hypothetical protein
VLWDAHRGGAAVSHMAPLSIIPRVLGFHATHDILEPPSGPLASAEQAAFRAFTSGLGLRYACLMRRRMMKVLRRS